ncbi:MAG TPA: IS21 family transposase [Vicinamibacteria bacterium]|nr:IS21 family transposase [Vicinamibacteria bacterium]
MAHREVTMLEVKEVLRLWRGGLPTKRVAAQLGFDAKTVRRYVRAAQECGLERLSGGPLDDELVAAVLARVQPVLGRPHGPGWALCTERQETIRAHLERGVRLSKIRKLLRREGVAVSYATLRRFAMAELGFGGKAPTIPVADCGPGEEIQLDTGWVGMLEPDHSGRRRRFRAWIFTAVRSRHRFVWPVFQETTESAIEACEMAWGFFGGIFRTLIVDNTKAIVQVADPLGARLNTTFLEYAQARGFVVDTTRVRKPKDKARVERSVQTVRDDCFAGERLFTLEQAREHARVWCLEEYGQRRHSTTSRRPAEHFEAEERPALLPAPAEPYDVPRWSKVKVAPDQHAQVLKALYSLPTRFVGRELLARADRSTVRFYEGGTVVKTHPRKLSGRSTDRSDFPPDKAAYALRDLEYLKRQAHRHGEAVGRFAEALLQTDLPWTRMRQVYALLGLVRRYGAERVQAACQTALQAGMIDARRLARLLELAAPASVTSPTVVALPARFLRSPRQYALPLPSSQASNQGEDR